MRFFDLSGRCKVVHMKMTRRSFGLGLATSAFALTRRPASALTMRGVRLGVQTYSFHDLRQGGAPAVEQISAAMKRLNLNICELFSPDVEPFPMPKFSWVPWTPSSSTTTAAGLGKLYFEEQHSPGFQKQREDCGPGARRLLIVISMTLLPSSARRESRSTASTLALHRT